MDKYKAFYDMVKKWTVSDYRTQKIKAEVIVDMLISEYIEDIVSCGVGEKVKLIAKEFPIARIGQPPIEKKGDSPSKQKQAGYIRADRQYASVDFLMSGVEYGKNVLYLVELKTSDDSVDGVQLWNMLWTCKQGANSLYNRFWDVVMNYGINENGNEISTKKYLHTLSQYALNYIKDVNVADFEPFCQKRWGNQNTDIKQKQQEEAEKILNSLYYQFDNVTMKIVYVSLSNNLDLAAMANTALNSDSIKKKCCFTLCRLLG